MQTEATTARQTSVVTPVADAASALDLLRDAVFELRTLEDAETLAACMARVFPNPAAARRGLHELMVNAIEHGNLGIGYEEKTALIKTGSWYDEVQRRLALPENAAKRVRVEFRHRDDTVRVTIADAGNGFDWTPFMTPALRLGDAPNGRGIAIANIQCFDTMSYISPGNVVVCTKRLVSKVGVY